MEKVFLPRRANFQPVSMFAFEAKKAL